MQSGPNTIFEVVRSKGGHTAWADKHPAYDLVNGPSGKGVEDLFTPEITNARQLELVSMPPSVSIARLRTIS